MYKLYYKDPLKAAYMAREFGVQILIENEKYEEDNGQDPYKYIADWYIICEQKKFYKDEGNIHPDSYDIFKPKGGDIGIGIGEYNYIYCYEDDNTGWGTEDCSPQLFAKDDKIEKILRDGKHFFMPEIERDNNDTE